MRGRRYYIRDPEPADYTVQVAPGAYPPKDLLDQVQALANKYELRLRLSPMKRPVKDAVLSIEELPKR